MGTLGHEHYDNIETYLHQIYKRRSAHRFILLGDLNLNKTSWDSVDSSCSVEQLFLDLFNDLGLTELVTELTHQHGNILDIVLTNHSNSITNLNVTDSLAVCKSDHRPITFEIKNKISRIKPCKRECTTSKSKLDTTK